MHNFAYKYYCLLYIYLGFSRFLRGSEYSGVDSEIKEIQEVLKANLAGDELVSYVVGKLISNPNVFYMHSNPITNIPLLTSHIPSLGLSHMSWFYQPFFKSSL